MKFASVLRELFRVEAPKGKLVCIECGCHVRKHERYKILAASHVNCADPKLVGQQSIPMPKEEK